MTAADPKAPTLKDTLLKNGTKAVVDQWATPNPFAALATDGAPTTKQRTPEEKEQTEKEREKFKSMIEWYEAKGNIVMVKDLKKDLAALPSDVAVQSPLKDHARLSRDRVTLLTDYNKAKDALTDWKKEAGKSANNGKLTKEKELKELAEKHKLEVKNLTDTSDRAIVFANARSTRVDTDLVELLNKYERDENDLKGSLANVSAATLNGPAYHPSGTHTVAEVIQVHQQAAQQTAFMRSREEVGKMLVNTFAAQLAQGMPLTLELIQNMANTVGEDPTIAVQVHQGFVDKIVHEKAQEQAYAATQVNSSSEVTQAALGIEKKEPVKPVVATENKQAPKAGPKAAPKPAAKAKVKSNVDKQRKKEEAAAARKKAKEEAQRKERTKTRRYLQRRSR